MSNASLGDSDAAHPAIKAYFIGGHGDNGENGDDDTRTFTVPKNCTIVVKAGAGECVWLDGRLQQSKKCKLHPDILKNPSAHPDEIYEAFGNVAIYTSGQKCPNFNYYLVSCFPSTQPFNTCSIFGSGVIDVDLFYKDSIENCEDRYRYSTIDKLPISPNRDEIFTYIRNLYKYSIFPSPTWTSNYIHNHVYNNESLPDILSIMYKNFKTTQKFLCEKFPGVYYNSVCRVNTASNNVFNTENTHTNTGARIYRRVLRNKFQSIHEENRKEKEMKAEQERKPKELNEKSKKVAQNYSAILSALTQRQVNLATDTAAADAVISEYELALQKQNRTSDNNETLKLLSNKRNQLVNKRSKTQQNVNTLKKNQDLHAKLLTINIPQQRRELRQQQLKPPKQIVQTLKNRIGESFHRKQLIRNVFNPAYVNRRRQEEYNKLEKQIINSKRSLAQSKSFPQAYPKNVINQLTATLNYAMKAKSFINKERINKERGAKKQHNITLAHSTGGRHTRRYNQIQSRKIRRRSH